MTYSSSICVLTDGSLPLSSHLHSGISVKPGTLSLYEGFVFLFFIKNPTNVVVMIFRVYFRMLTQRCFKIRLIFGTEFYSIQYSIQLYVFIPVSQQQLSQRAFCLSLKKGQTSRATDVSWTVIYSLLTNNCPSCMNEYK